MQGTLFINRLSTVVLCVSALTFPVITSADTLISDEALDAWFKKGKYDQVIATLEDEKNKSAERFSTYISALMNTDLDDAEEAAEDFINAYPENYRVYMLHASVMGAQAGESIFSALGYAKKARTSLEKAIEVAPDEIRTYQALFQYHLFVPSIAGGDMDTAKSLVADIAALDPDEGQIAEAKYLLAGDKKEEGISLLKMLMEKPETRVYARYVLGDQYMSDEAYPQAFETLQPLLTLRLEAASEEDQSAWEAYSENRFNQLYGLYRLGQTAVQSGEYTGTGIQALETYLSELPEAGIDTDGLPSLNWAHLRLAELYLHDNNKEQAKLTLQRISGKEDGRFGKLLKKLQKKV